MDGMFHLFERVRRSSLASWIRSPKRPPSLPLSRRERVPGGRVRGTGPEEKIALRSNRSILAGMAIGFLLLALSAGLSIAREPVASPLPSASPASDGLDERTPVDVPRPSALALQFERGGNWLWVVNHIWALAVPALLLFTGASARLRDLAAWIGRTWFFTIGVYVVLYTATVFVASLPLSYFQGYIRLHAYGLSEQTLGRWLGNALKFQMVSMAVGFCFACVPFWLLARSPRRWWLWTTLLTVPFLFGVMLLKPIWVDPLFNDFGRMRDEALERDILALARRAGIEASRVFEVDKSRDTKTVNAYVTGVLGAKRIVLWDTLVDKLGEKELLFVMAHEMGHYALGHVVRSVLLSTLGILASLFVVDRVGRLLIGRFRERFGFDRLSDVASVPLLLLVMEMTSLVVIPAAFAYSRHQEHEADRFALELTRSNRSGALAFGKFVRENLSNPRPNPLLRPWRATHPSIGERIEFCNSYHPWSRGQPLRYGALFRP